MVEQSCKEVILDQNIDSLRPFEAAVKLRPDVILHPWDQYTAALLWNFHSDFESVLVLCGYG